VLSSAAGQQLIARYRRDYVTRRCRELIGELRVSILDGHTADDHELSEAAILARLEQRIRAERDTMLTRVVNATWTVLHTNLGRALLPRAAIEALTASAGHHINLEYDLARLPMARTSSCRAVS
jgi:L-seryl-tRNA(Ser) seleniumtransferase